MRSLTATTSLTPAGLRRPAEAAPPARAVDPAVTSLTDAPYAFGPEGQVPVTPALRQKFARPGLRAGQGLGYFIHDAEAPGGLKPKPSEILGSIRSHPHRTGAIGEKLPSVEALFPADFDRAGAKTHLLAALGDFPVQRADGSDPQSLLTKIQSSILAPEQKVRVLDCMTELFHSFGLRDFDRAGADMNWKHLCAEAAQILDAAEAFALTPAQTEDALLGSLFSDAVKFTSTLLTHNVDGAVGAAHVLSRGYFDTSTPEGAQRLAGIVRIALEHQISPPSFMAMIAGSQIRAALKAEGLPIDRHAPAIASLQRKLASPLSPEYQEVDATGGMSLRFTPAEKALLRRIGIDGWPVPHPATPWFQGAMTVVTADSIVNYAMAEGVGKIVEVSGPGTPFANKEIFESIFSTGVSYLDAGRLVPPELAALYAQAARGTRTRVAEVTRQVDDELRSGWLDFDAAYFDEISLQEKVSPQALERRDADGKVWVKVPTEGEEVPYFHRPLLQDATPEEVAFAKLLRRKVADLLRDTPS